MKSIKIIYGPEIEDSINFIFLSGRFIAWYGDDERDQSIIWSKETIEDYITGRNWSNFSPGKNTIIDVAIMDEDSKECLSYKITEIDSLLKDDVEIASENAKDALEISLVELIESTRIRWINPLNRHYFYPHLKIIIYTGDGDSYSIKLHPWPTDDEYGFIKDEYYFYTGEITWGKDFASDLWFCSKKNLINTMRDILEEEEYLGTLPIGLDCMIINELIPDIGEVDEDVISEIDELRLNDAHEQITDENLNDKWNELQEKCNSWILDEVKHFIDWFEENPFNIAVELKDHEETDQDCWENAESVPE